MKSFDDVWQIIVEQEGSEFQQVRGKIFTYQTVGNAITPSTTNYIISRSQLEKAWKRMPVNGPGEFQDLIGPSYLFAILTDPRIPQKTQTLMDE
ncbi:hypothetical protein ACFQ3J_20940 [Paenibacillus provencensis]|uniref:GyrI-like small molecule binding domain-containing protein n=1 Tax=Paenibacillus provencensis TaxID=441151 RepID=A0ABW3Q0Q9_9BACL